MQNSLSKPFAHARFRVGDADLFYQLEGRIDGPRLVLLHGGLGSLEDFDALAPTLGERYRLLRIDSRGHGRSTRGTTPLTYALLQADVEALLERLGFTEVNVLGFSDGGIIGYRLAMSRRTHVSKLATIGASWRAPDSKVLELLSSVTPERWREKFPKTYERYQMLNPEPHFNAFVNAIVHMWTDLEATGYPGELVKEISCPVWVARGDVDHLLPLEELDALRQKIEKLHLLNVPFAGHEVHKEQPEIVLSSLLQFLRS